MNLEGSSLVWRADAPYTLDVSEFQEKVEHAGSAAELRQAIALYKGPLFQSCYDDWVLPERERLQQMYLAALGRLVEMLENQGDYRGAIQYAQLLLHHDPLHEDVYRTLMRLYALGEDRAAALRTYQTCRAVLQKELDVEPSPATHQAYQRLLELPSAAKPAAHPAPPLVGHSRE
ncbi:MAG: hypothetical protein HY782_27670, partial [Chloroflexi bacterium]|nr:hypothetical protein [Chloroflexota bacterium]